VAEWTYMIVFFSELACWSNTKRTSSSIYWNV